MRPVYDRLNGGDGYVSLEVSPYLALDTEDTVAEARRLWRAVDRPNLMIKVPGTRQGLPAIRQLIGEGININVTLLFRATPTSGGRGLHRRPGDAAARATISAASPAWRASSSAASTRQIDKAIDER